MIIPRRRFLTLMAAPAIVRASSLMRVRGIVMPMPGSRLYSAFHSALLKGGVAIEWTESGVLVHNWEPSGEITSTTRWST